MSFVTTQTELLAAAAGNLVPAADEVSGLISAGRMRPSGPPTPSQPV